MPEAVPADATTEDAGPLGVIPPQPLLRSVRAGGLAESIALLWIYLTYSQARALAAGSERVAREHAARLLTVERFFGLDIERSTQELALRADWLVAFWNLWYGTIHFLAPVAVLAVLWRSAPARYLRMRNTLLITFGLGLVLFLAFPLMPPRLMPSSYGFVDTGREYFHVDSSLRTQFGGDDKPTTSDFAQGANDFAAMPSMHVTWSTWVALALWPLARRRWLRALLVAYPASILVCVTVTANHWLLDAAGAWLVLAASYRLALAIERVTISRRSARLTVTT